MSVGTYSLPALPYAYNVCPLFPAYPSCEPLVNWALPELSYAYAVRKDAQDTLYSTAED